MSFSEFEEFDDPAMREETLVPQDTYEVAEIIQRLNVDCDETRMKNYRHYRHIDLKRVSPAVQPSDQTIRKYAESWENHVRQNTGISTKHISEWERICRFVGWMKFAIVANAKRREQNETGRYLFPNKGLYLYGLPGSFKTYTAREIANFLRIPFYDVFSIDEQYKKSGELMFDSPAFRGLKREHCIIDDIGAESGGKYYGNSLVLSALLKERMTMLDTRKIVTVITSNVPPEDLQELDERTHSNVLGMCMPVLFSGPDMRQKPTADF